MPQVRDVCGEEVLHSEEEPVQRRHLPPPETIHRWREIDRVHASSGLAEVAGWGEAGRCQRTTGRDESG